MVNNHTRVFAMYLPQYHAIPENSLFWGEGFTDWVSVKNAKPLFQGHNQPKVPLHNNYYDLSVEDDIKSQVALANKYGVDGWGIYHYWFNNKQNLLSKPSEIILNNKEIDIKFFFAWDNTSWKRTWSNVPGNDWAPIQDNSNNINKNEPEVLVEYILGEKSDWEQHFNYLLPFFKDNRYEKHKNKPIFIIMRYSSKVYEMAEYWDMLAKQNGFDGMEIIYSYNPFHGIKREVYKFKYEPLYSAWGTYKDRIKRLLSRNKSFNGTGMFDYDKSWDRLLRSARLCKDKRMYYGAFVSYDDTPRRGDHGKIIMGSEPGKFENYLKKLLEICKNQSKPYIFLTAWNEWGEGAMLEPDEKHGYSYLEALKRACMESK